VLSALTGVGSKILKFVKLESVNADLVSSMAARFGLTISDAEAGVAASMLKGVAKEHGFDNLGQLIESPQLEEIIGIFRSTPFASKIIGDMSKEKVDDGVLRIHEETFVSCPHCGRLISPTVFIKHKK
jgi:hypothetical protein